MLIDVFYCQSLEYPHGGSLTHAYLYIIIRLPNKLVAKVIKSNHCQVSEEGEDVDIQNNATAQKLLSALMQFKRADWHQTTFMGYKPSELRVLFCIGKGFRSEGLSELKVSEISRRLHVTSPTVTQLIKGLEAHGLVERNVDPVDRRAVGIKLTEKGEQVTRRASEQFIASIGELVEYLGEEESEQFAELLLKVSRYYTEKAASANGMHWSGEEDL